MAGERTVRVRFVGDASSAVSAGKAAEKAVVGALSAQEGAAQKLVAAQAKAAAQVEAIQARGAAAAAAIGTKAAATAEATIAKGAAAQVRAAAAIEAAHIRAATAAGATAAKVAIEQERSAARTAQAHIKAAAQVESASVRAASGSSKAFLSMGKALDNVRAFALKAIVAFAGFSAIKNFLGGAIKDATENATASTEKVLARLKVAGDFFQTEVKEKIGAALLSFFDVIVQKLMPAIQQIVSGVGPVADVARAFGAAWQVAADIVMAVAVPAFEVAKATVEGVRVAIEEASDSPVTWAEIFAASASTITTTANDIKIRVDQAFTIMAGAATFAFLKIPIVVGNALAKVLELAVSALQKAASIIPADLGGDLIQKIADKAAGMGVSLRAGAADGQQAIDDLFDKVVQLNDGIGKQGDVLDAVGPKQEDHTRRTKEQREEAEKFQKALDSMLASVGAFTFAEITNQTKLFVAALASVPKGSQAYAELTIKVGEFADKLAGAGKEVPAALREIADDVRGFIGPALEEAADREKRIGEEATKAAAAVDGLRSSLGLITQSDFDSKLALMTNELERLKGLPGTEVAVADLTDQMAKMGEAGKKSGIEIGNTAALISGEFGPAVQTAAERQKDAADKAAKYARSLYDVSGAALDAVSSLLSGGGLLDAIGAIGQAFAQGKDAGLKFGDVLGTMLGTKGSAADGGRTSGEEYADAFGGAVSGFASNKAKGLGAQIGGGIGGGLGGYFLGPLGGMLGGKIGGLIGGLFGGKPAYKKVQDTVRKNLGVALSEGTAQAIADVGKSLGVSNQIAGLLNLDKIVGEASITSGNAGKFAAEFGKLMTLAQSGAKGSTEAIKAIGAAFPALIGKFKEAGMEGTKAFGDLVRSAKTMAGSVPEIAAFLKAGVAEATGALGVLFGAIRLEGAGAAKAMENLGAISTDVLTAMASLPGGARAAIDQLGDGLDKIVEKAKAAGVALPAGIAGLIGQREFFKANKDLYDSVDALVTITRSLGETGFISAQGFAAIQSQAATTFDQLTAAGRALPDALADMAPVLQEIINEAGRNGQVIDANTQGLIDQAAALGLVKVAGTDAFAAMRAESNYLLTGIADIFGKKIPEYVTQAGSAGVTAAQTVNQAWTGAATSASASWSGTAASIATSHATVTTAIASTATAVSASIATTAAATAASVAAATDNTGNAFARLMGRIRSARFELGDLESAVPKFAEGTDYVPKTMLALVHKGERIIPAAENAEISRGQGSGGTRTVGRGGGNSLVGTTMYLQAEDGAPLGRYVVRTVKRGLDEQVINPGQREF